MNYDVIPTPRFDSDVEFYIKKRKYRHIRNDIAPILIELEKGNLIGDEISGISAKAGEHTYKVRAANTDMKQGKSNGYRLIYYAIQDDGVIFLLTLYYKKDDNRIPTDEEIVGIIEQYCK
ncbi:MAG: hypothetical protein FWD71_06560 [Oscillospiraceae bacterium]|nr:hypothetical protein [Oscillospiraceae bacterium]